MNKTMIGQVLVEHGHIEPEELERALATQASSGMLLGRILVEQGALHKESLAVGLAQQRGVAWADPSRAEVDAELLARVPRDVAVRLRALPLTRNDDGAVVVAMVEPMDVTARRGLEFLLGGRVQPVVCHASAMRQAFAAHYGVERELAAILRAVKPHASQPIPRILDIDLQEVERRLRAGGTRPYIDLLNLLLANAHASRASDVHVEASEESVRIRYRIDGVMRTAMTLPKWVEAGLISRIKVVGRMDLSMHHSPQDGKVRAHIGGRDQDLRIATIPSQFGETCVLRLLDPSILDLDLQDLGVGTHDLQTFYRLISRPQGMVLITGPTGSGKSTTLYATIRRLRTEQTKIVTIEDPIEYTLAGITQVQVDERRGLTFASAIRAMLRQDPNVMVIGEIRDGETAAAAFEAAMTGHLVFATLHTGDTVAAITRLRDLGLPLYMIESSLLGVVAQRLVRRLCPHCRTAAEPGEEVWRVLEREPVELGRVFEAGAGCRECLYTGYRGRAGLFEVLRIDESLRATIADGADERTLRAQAAAAGLRPLLEAGLEQVRDCVTSLHEVGRHVRGVLASAWPRAEPPASAATPVVPSPADTPAAAGMAVPTAAAPEEPWDADAADTLSPDTVADDTATSGGANVPDHILVVDDSQEILDLVRYTLEGAGYRVTTAGDGIEALATIERLSAVDPVHMVVLDVMMPGMTGFDVCERLKRELPTAFLPVLILSARGDRAHIKSGFRAGADDYLPKPFDPEELVLRIQALLRRAYRADPTDPA